MADAGGSRSFVWGVLAMFGALKLIVKIWHSTPDPEPAPADSVQDAPAGWTSCPTCGATVPARSIRAGRCQPCRLHDLIA